MTAPPLPANTEPNDQELARTRIGVIGCGSVSELYLQTFRRFDVLDVVSCADRDPMKSKAISAQYDVSECSVDSLLGDPSISIVANLTVPRAHAEVSLAAIAAGKSVYSEKPLATTTYDARAVLDAANTAGVRVGCAPDTFLGGGLQTCRKLIDSGAIGEPVAAVAFMAVRGPESWHPSPQFLYEPGAGPLFDRGPYYITALVALLGPVRRVTASARITFPTRTIETGSHRGRTFAVTTPTHVAATLDLASGVVVTLLMSFDVQSHTLPPIEIYGADATLGVPDPETFGGPVHLLRSGHSERTTVPLAYGRTELLRGLGVLDLASALRWNRSHRMSCELALHVLDVMDAILESAEIERHVDITSTCPRPASLPLGLTDTAVDS